MTVSAVVPTYNREAEVQRAVKSVLSQTYDDIQCIVVDDGSSDGTAEKVKSLEDSRIEYIQHDTNRGVSAARNTGIEAADGDYIAFLDSDDEWEPRKIERQVQEIESRPTSWNSIYCDVNKRRNSRVKQFFDKVVSEDIGREGGRELIEDVISMDLSVHGGSTLLVERESVLDIGGFDETMQRHEELEFLVRLLENGKMAYTDRKLVTLHDTGYPKADLLEREKKKFLQKVERHTRHGESDYIEDAHQIELAKAYFREGSRREAIRHMAIGRSISYRNLAGLIWSIIVGLR